VKLKNLPAALSYIHKAGLSAFVKGAPGTGKTTALRQYAKDAKLELINIHAPLSDLLDIKGALSVREHVAQFLPLKKWPAKDDAPVLVLIDEFPQCVPAIQNGYSQLLIEKIIGEVELPKGSFVAATGNRREDKAATHNTPRHIDSRVVELNVELDHAGFLDWAMKNKLHKMVVAFGNFRPGCLFNFDPKTIQGPYACYRTWEYASDLLKQNPPLSLIDELLSGVLGSAVVGEFMAFRTTYLNLPNAKEILQDPENAELPSEPGTLYALSSAIAYAVDDSTADNFVTLADMLPIEYAAVMIKTTQYQFPAIKKNKKFGAWAMKHPEMFMQTMEEKAATT
jgi:hypothetical protein